ncbi:MAG: head GIN domain-containing protein [Chitinophagaceae bacterium]
MKKVLLACLYVLSGIAVMAQKQINDPNAEVRNVSSFHAIKVGSGINVLLTQGSSPAVAVSASETEYRERIVTEVKDGVLNVYFENSAKSIWKNVHSKKLKAYIAVTNIDGIHVNSGADVKTEGTLKAGDLNIQASSGANFKGDVQATSITVKQNSGSTINISGTTGSLDVACSSGSSFHGYDLTSDNCKAGVSSGAGVQTTVNKELSATASSGGYVNYKGEGVIRDIRTGSGGSVSKKSK